MEVHTYISFITFHSSVKEADEFGIKENSIKVKSYSLLVQQENTSQGADQTDIYNIWLCNSGQSEGHVTSKPSKMIIKNNKRDLQD